MDLRRWDSAVADSRLDKLSRFGIKVRGLDAITGGLSKPSKMPGLSFNLPALVACNVGSKLAKVEGSVCADCYACKGRYVFPNVQAAMHRRLSALRADPESWAAAMVLRIRGYKGDRGKWFRWHDSGDLLGPRHYRALCWIARQCPGTKFWLPTREYGTVMDGHYEAPSNLVSRLSVHMVGKPAPKKNREYAWSTVGVGEGRQCPAPQQGGKCGECRSCWDPTVEVVDYHLH